MPPKRGAVRRNGSTPSGKNGPSTFLDTGLGSMRKSQALPNIPTKPSFAYGAADTPLLPRALVLHPEMDLTEMAGTIDKGIEDAKDRNMKASEPPRSGTRPRSVSSVGVSPARRRREPTPDQLQLFDTLREATQTPSPIQGNGASTATPTPPVAHTLSPSSSASIPQPKPRYPHVAADSLYPSPMTRLGPKTGGEPPVGSSPQFDNSSLLSYSVERDIHNDDLRRTLSDGKNIKAPPRRFSGLAFANEPIHEEEEPDSRLQQSPSPELSDGDLSDGDFQLEATPESQLESEYESVRNPSPAVTRSPAIKRSPAIAKSPAKSKSPAINKSPAMNKPSAVPKSPAKPPVRNKSPVMQSAPTKTIIPDTHVQHTAQAASAHDRQRSRTPHDARPARSYFAFLPSKSTVVRFFTMVTVAVALFALFRFARLPSVHRYVPMNETNLVAIDSLTDEMSRLSAHVSSLAHDVKIVKNEVRFMPSVVAPPIRAPTAPSVPSVPSIPQTPVVWKTNFLSPGLGVIINPYITTPTFGPTLTYLQIIHRKIKSVFLTQPRLTQPPLAALTSWDDFGDCWCSAPREDTGMVQLGIHLGQAIVPEEVIVEHMPKTATLLPDVAPRDMELWARFRSVGPKPSSSSLPSFLRNFISTVRVKAYMSPLSHPFPFHDSIINTLSYAFPGDPESAYSDDALLGPSFYRVGKWAYDLNNPQHIQRFVLDAIIDDPQLRVDMVVFRVNANYGANHTCLYRLKLFGHL
ncbi:hypothetical protein BO71DRAFT_444344 [Aspergillus ellipticus CBS 707.79]|uniref:SUN domain-containing protein n=1 Tax=Aspergillus ellipticus CBS 707.79 TaxID=1448320 RepID=A0A319CY23_9EURO|nr:hypothetical protein BO71DRAFT_444344 [Aspergillus ellipticus CBS 707.79]